MEQILREGWSWDLIESTSRESHFSGLGKADTLIKKDP